MIAFNRHVRGREDGEFFDDAPWPDGLLVIGSEADQNYFAVDRTGDGAVLLYDHADGSLTQIADSLPAYADWLVDWWDDIRRRNET